MVSNLLFFFFVLVRYVNTHIILAKERDIDPPSQRQVSSENSRARCKSCFLTLLGFSIPMALLAVLLLGTLSKELLEVALGRQGIDALSLYLVRVLRI